MDDILTLHSFGKYDRSGKIRWLANELKLPIKDISLQLGEHRQSPYLDLNPYAAIPTAQWRGKTIIESEAIMTFVAEQFPESGLIVEPGDTGRADYLMWMAVASNTLETKLVEYTLSEAGVLPAEIKSLTKDTLVFKLNVVLKQLPPHGFLVAERFTLADISLAYCLRLAVNAQLLKLSQVEQYLKPLMERPAAVASEFFSSFR